ncbi:MAG: DUF1186 domain-containing protein [Desulfobacteraceae bacterium]|nr:MAG: DUF1186 domain-containing protein [Desulfobacteraceae bacterium]
MHDLYPEESLEVLWQAYEDELVFPGMIAFSDFEKAISLGKDKCIEKLKRDLERDSLDDIHAGMSWWSCFNKGSKAAASSGVMKNGLFPGSSERGASQLPKDEKKNKKKKRKQAKASKKKNRR